MFFFYFNNLFYLSQFIICFIIRNYYFWVTKYFNFILEIKFIATKVIIKLSYYYYYYCFNHYYLKKYIHFIIIIIIFSKINYLILILKLNLILFFRFNYYLKWSHSFIHFFALNSLINFL